VRAGDTLQSIAVALWGDQSLWYKLAEANGLGAAGGLTEGQSLIVPPGILASGHSASAFKPYDAAKAMGDLSPGAVKPAKKGGCGMMGQILLIAIAVAVSAVVAPWATGILAAQGIGIGGVAGAALGGAIGGAVGSIASQAVGIATGNQSGFNWKGVGLAALGGAIGGGLGKFGAMSQAGSATTGSGAAINGTLGKIGQFLGKGAFVNDVAQGVLGNVATQGIGLATGLQDKFSWAGVASAGLIAGVSGAVTRGLTPGGAGAMHETLHGNPPAPSFAAVQAGSAAGALAGAAARSLITGTSFGDNLIAVLPDVIGSTLGNMFVRGIQGSGSRGLTEPAEEKPLQFAEASQPVLPGQAVTASDGSFAGGGEPGTQLIDLPLSLTSLDVTLPPGPTVESLVVPLPRRLLSKASIPTNVNHLDLRGGPLSALVQMMAMVPGRELLITRPDGKTVDTSGVIVSGYEAPYDGEFNLDEYIGGNNCWAYALNDPQSTRTSLRDFPQPGDIAGIDIRDYQSYDPDTKATTIHLDRLEAAIRRDGRAGRVDGRDAIIELGRTPESTLDIPDGYYVVALVVDIRDKRQDYHWYRHNPDGTWSGKGGNGRATNLDYDGNVIRDVPTANRFVREYTDPAHPPLGTLNYERFVRYYAVRADPGVQVPRRRN
jgi:hypothetical protein